MWRVALLLALCLLTSDTDAACSHTDTDVTFNCNCELWCANFPDLVFGGEGSGGPSCFNSQNGGPVCQSQSEYCVPRLNNVYQAECWTPVASASGKVFCDGVEKLTLYTEEQYVLAVKSACDSTNGTHVSFSASRSASQSAAASSSSSPTHSASYSSSGSHTDSASPSDSGSHTHTVSASSTPSRSPSLTPSPTPNCDAGALCAIAQAAASPKFLSYDAFLTTCVAVEATGSCGCAAFTGYNNTQGVLWTSPCLRTITDPPGSAVDRCSDLTSSQCTGPVFSVHSSNCWDQTVACVDGSGDSLVTLTVGSQSEFEGYFEDADSHPVVLPSPSPTPSISVSPSVTPTPSRTPSVTPSITPTRSPTRSITPTHTPTPSITPSPSKLHDFQNDWLLLEPPSNLNPVESYLGSFPRDVIQPNILKWNDMDATISHTCEGPKLNYTCEWVLQTSIRILVDSGYSGLRIWSVYDDGGTDKILVVDNHYLWQPGVPCLWNGEDCPLLDLTVSAGDSGQFKAAYFEFRMASFNDTRTSPFVVEWIDEFLIPHGMRPSLNETLLVYEPYDLPVGIEFDFNTIAQSGDMMICMIILCFFAVTLISIMVYSAFKKKPVTDTRQYVLNTEGFRTITINGKPQIKRSQTYDRNKLRMKHVPFILIVLMWRIAYSILFTMTLFWVFFTTLNKAHLDTMDLWDRFSADRDSQLLSLITRMEETYRNETDRIAAEYAYNEASCNVTNDLEVEFVALQTEIAAYHDSEIEQRQNGSFSSQTVLYSVSLEKACSISNPGVLFEKNSLYSVQSGANGTLVQVPVNITGKTTDEIFNLLRAPCEAEAWCEGFSYNNLTSDYFLFYQLATPVLDETDGQLGFCYGVSTIVASFPGDDIDALNQQLRDSYVTRNNASLIQANEILRALASTDAFELEVDRSPNNEYGFSEPVYYVTNQGGSTSFDVSMIFFCPSCPEEFESTSLQQLDGTTQRSNATYQNNLNTTVFIQTFFVNVTGLELNITEPDLTFLEPPTWEWDFYNVYIPPRVFKIVIALDVLMFVFRTIVTMTIISKYIRGIPQLIPATALGKDVTMVQWVASSTAGLACTCLLWCGKKVKKWDHTLWLLVGKLTLLLQLAVFFMVVLIVYWVVDNVITLETFEQFGVFSAMTAAPAIQRTLRNEQLVTGAYALNQVAQAQFKFQIETKGNELLARQEQFNEGEFEQVSDFNEDYCSKLAVLLRSPFEMTVTNISSACCPSILTSGQSLEFSLESASEDGISNYIIDQIVFDFSWNPGSKSCYSSSEVSTRLAEPILQGNYVLLSSSASGGLNDTQSVTLESWDAIGRSPPSGTGGCAANTFLTTQITTLTFSPSLSSNIRASTLRLNIVAASERFSLTSVAVTGRVSVDDEFECDEVEFREMQFDPMDYVGECDTVAPISVNMMRMFDRDRWTVALKDAHTPFISATRNIMLSPFYILLVGVAVFFIATLFLVLLEWVMIKADFVRANPHAQVPVVIAYKSGKNAAQLSMLQPNRRFSERHYSMAKHDRMLTNGEIELTETTTLTVPPLNGGKHRAGGTGGKHAHAEWRESVKEGAQAGGVPVTITEAEEGEGEREREQGESPTATSADSDEWLPVATHTGETYFYNPGTGETSWTKPLRN